MAIEFVSYSGQYPTLCFGTLILRVHGSEVIMGRCLSSGGSVSFDENWDEEITEGPWSVDSWPSFFDEDMKKEALEVINDNIPWGCCGGCA